MCVSTDAVIYWIQIVWLLLGKSVTTSVDSFWWFGSKGHLLLVLVLRGVDGPWIVNVLVDDSYIILGYPSHLVD